MKIKMEEDFICVQTRYEATLIFKDCTESCSFCPAAKLKKFYNLSLLQQELTTDLKVINVYGHIDGVYTTAFFTKYLDQNPNVELKMYVCKCQLPPEIKCTLYMLMHPILPNYMQRLPEYISIPASGTYEQLLLFAKHLKSKYKDIPLKIETYDAPDPEDIFLSQESIENLQKQIDAEDYRI